MLLSNGNLMQFIVVQSVESAKSNIMLSLNNAAKQFLGRLLVDVEFCFSLIHRRIPVQQSRKKFRLKCDDTTQIDYTAITFTGIAFHDSNALIQLL